MLRKSHSSEWAVLSANTASETAGHSAALQQHFGELKAELHDFTSVFTSWTVSRRRVLYEDKETYERTLAEEHGNSGACPHVIILRLYLDLVEALKKQLASLVAKRQQIVTELQAEQREFEEGVKANQELDAQRQNLGRRLAEVKEKIARISQEVANQARLLAEHEEAAQAATLRDLLEATLGREKLGLSVDSVEENVTKFTFKYIDPANWERKFMIAIDVSTNHYRVKFCEPMIPQLSNLVMVLEEEGDFYAFLRRVRQAFFDLISVK